MVAKPAERDSMSAKLSRHPGGHGLPEPEGQFGGSTSVTPEASRGLGLKFAKILELKAR
jgi:hypothetical protein